MHQQCCAPDGGVVAPMATLANGKWVSCPAYVHSPPYIWRNWMWVLICMSPRTHGLYVACSRVVVDRGQREQMFLDANGVAACVR